jgi:hypothetical protein
MYHSRVLEMLPECSWIISQDNVLVFKTKINVAGFCQEIDCVEDNTCAISPI